MKRSDRLMNLMQILRDGRFYRAEDLANRLNVSLRTIYRDMDTLAASGIPIEGLRGLGYQITAPVTLPPLNLTMTELEALHLGLMAVAQADDKELKDAAHSLSGKLDAVLPEDRNAPQPGWGFATYPFAESTAGFQHMPAIRSAIRARQKLAIDYEYQAGQHSQHLIRPLSVDYWGRVWTATCWCETSSEFMELRIDLIRELTVLPALFVEEPGRSLADFQSQK